MDGIRCGQGVFFCQTRSFALRFLLANSHTPLRAAHGNAPSGWTASCHGQLSTGAIEVPIRSHRAVCRIWFNKKIFLDRTGPTSDQSEYIFYNHYRWLSPKVKTQDPAPLELGPYCLWDLQFNSQPFPHRFTFFDFSSLQARVGGDKKICQRKHA